MFFTNAITRRACERSTYLSEHRERMWPIVCARDATHLRAEKAMVITKLWMQTCAKSCGYPALAWSNRKSRGNSMSVRKIWLIVHGKSWKHISVEQSSGKA